MRLIACLPLQPVNCNSPSLTQVKSHHLASANLESCYSHWTQKAQFQGGISHFQLWHCFPGRFHHLCTACAVEMEQPQDLPRVTDGSGRGNCTLGPFQDSHLSNIFDLGHLNLINSRPPLNLAFSKLAKQAGWLLSIQVKCYSLNPLSTLLLITSCLFKLTFHLLWSNALRIHFYTCFPALTQQSTHSDLHTD